MSEIHEIPKTYTLNLTFGQIRVLHLALEKYIRNHDVILHDCKFNISEMKLLFADMSRHCDLCEILNSILHEHDSSCANPTTPPSISE